MVKDFFGEADKSLIDWTSIDQYQKKGSYADLCMALIECDKLLNHMLALKGYRGKNIYERVASAKEAIHDIGGLAFALEIKDNVVAGFDKEVSAQELLQAIEKYKETIKDIEASNLPEVGWLDMVKKTIDYYFISKPERFREIVIGFIVFLLLIIVLDNTHFGQKLVHLISSVFAGAISWILILAIIVGILIIISSAAVIIGRAKSVQREQGKIDLPDDK